MSKDREFYTRLAERAFAGGSYSYAGGVIEKAFKRKLRAAKKEWLSEMSRWHGPSPLAIHSDDLLGWWVVVEQVRKSVEDAAQIRERYETQVKTATDPAGRRFAEIMLASASHLEGLAQDWLTTCNDNLGASLQELKEREHKGENVVMPPEEGSVFRDERHDREDAAAREALLAMR